jgi:glutamyl-tRNA reductase
MSAVFSDLTILEFRPGDLSPEALEPHLNPEFEFSIQTCQRTLVLSLRSFGLPSVLLNTGLLNTGRRAFHGVEAYCYFLQFACGLESQIQGETDVFGQVKIAFRQLQERNPVLGRKFRGTFASWLEDTKEIRAQFLQNIGGNNYGALSRRLLNPQASDSVVVIGAGLISKTVAPYFAEFNLSVWNRTAERLTELATQLSRKGNLFTALTDDQALSKAIEHATIVILATPPDAVLPAAITSHLRPDARVLHLGGQQEQLTALHELGTRLTTLTDLFELDREQSIVRKKQVRQALDACHQRSLLRSLARSIHIAHGWEDLALFS